MSPISTASQIHTHSLTCSFLWVLFALQIKWKLLYLAVKTIIKVFRLSGSKDYYKRLPPPSNLIMSPQIGTCSNGSHGAFLAAAFNMSPIFCPSVVALSVSHLDALCTTIPTQNSSASVPLTPPFLRDLSV